jgi:hypothetical protein
LASGQHRLPAGLAQSEWQEIGNDRSRGGCQQSSGSMSKLLCVASIGRSGTTFLQRLLNTHPEVLVFGEHNGFLTGIREAYDALTAQHVIERVGMSRSQVERILRAEPVTMSSNGWSIEWTNAMHIEAAAPLFARLIQDLIYPPQVRSPTHRYWGFKEIRYRAEDLVFLAKVFPDARFLMLVRDPIAVYRSQCRLGWAQERDARAAADAFHGWFSALARSWSALRGSAALATRARLICYERLLADPERHLMAVAGWLALRPFVASKVAAVVAADLSPAKGNWTPEMARFHDAYVTAYGDLDRRRYQELIPDAIEPRPHPIG